MKLWRYIQGLRKGKEAHQLEKEAMNDPFLAHALRGYDRVEGNHIEQLQQLQKEVRQKTTRPSVYLRAAGIAASVLLVVGFATYLLVQKSPFTDEMQLAVFHELEPDTAVPAVPALPVVAAEEQIAQAKARKIVPEVQTPTPVASTPVESLPDTEEDSALSSELEEVAVTRNQPNIEKALAGTVAGVAITRSPVIKGKVTDKEGSPIIGASVMVDGTPNGTMTGVDGHFELQANDGSKIKVSYIGYENMDILADTGKVMQIAMHEDQTALDEVVVVGYGAAKNAKLKQNSSVKENKILVSPGKKAFNKYVKENLIRPTDGECRHVKGKVVLRFSVNQQGRPVQVVVERSLCPSADAEAIRLLNQGPHWAPGSNSMTVEVKF